MKIADVVEKIKIAYQWLGGHPAATAFILGLIAGFTLGRAV